MKEVEVIDINLDDLVLKEDDFNKDAEVKQDSMGVDTDE